MGLVDNTKNEMILSHTMISGNNGLFWKNDPTFLWSHFFWKPQKSYHCTLFSYFLGLIGCWQKNFLKIYKEGKRKNTMENFEYKNSLSFYSCLFMSYSTNITQQLLKMICKVHSTSCFSIELNLHSNVEFQKSFFFWEERRQNIY